MTTALSVLIPVYQRFTGALRASRSVLTHNQTDLETGRIRLIICDDASPSIDPDELRRELAAIHPLIEFRRNVTNLGMSANILGMVESCRSFYCTILTDDDWFEPGALTEILRQLESGVIQKQSVTSIMSPRYSYLESGELAAVSCQIQDSDYLFPAKPRGQALPLAEGAYILSGYFFRPDCVDFDLWRQHIGNAFFPIIYSASIMKTGSTLYLNQSLVHHTTQNLCHWQAWGESDQAQQVRLCHDYLESLAIVSGYGRSRNRSLGDRVHTHQQRMKSYNKRLIEKRDVVLADLGKSIPLRLWVDPAFLQAFVRFLYFIFRTDPGFVIPGSRQKGQQRRW
jgi:hypothetical protein